SAYVVVENYLSAEILGVSFLVHSGTVLGIILGLELAGLSFAVRFFAWLARQGGIPNLSGAPDSSANSD
ncbi:hypothetical protein, partial [Pseudomonas sp.]|uniref:hypothetical protein n=1 Tax=Pseudomonas sp. TaxID=306 RepID=UPI00333FCDD8